MQQMVATYARHNNIKLPKMKYSLYGGQVISRGFKEKLLSIFGGRPVVSWSIITQAEEQNLQKSISCKKRNNYIPSILETQTKQMSLCDSNSIDYGLLVCNNDSVIFLDWLRYVGGDRNGYRVVQRYPWTRWKQAQLSSVPTKKLRG